MTIWQQKIDTHTKRENLWTLLCIMITKNINVREYAAVKRGVKILFQLGGLHTNCILKYTLFLKEPVNFGLVALKFSQISSLICSYTVLNFVGK